MEEKKIIISTDNNHKKGEFTFSYYLKSVKTFKWWILAITLAFMILGYLFLSFFYNPKKQKTNYQFTYDIALNKQEIKNEAKTTTVSYTYSYIDGTPYNYAAITGINNVKALIASNEKYSKLDPEDVASALSISPVTFNETILPFQYDVNASVKPFKNAKQAQSFVKDLIEYTNNYAQSLVSSYSLSSYLTNDFSNYDFTTQIQALKDQYYRVVDAYNVLGSEFPSAQVVFQSGETIQLSTLAQDFYNKYNISSSLLFDSDYSNLSRNKYLAYSASNIYDNAANTLANLETKRDDDLRSINLLEQQIAIYQESIKNLTNNLSGSEVVLDEDSLIAKNQKKIEELRIQQNTIKKELELLGYEAKDTNNDGNYELTSLGNGQIIYLNEIVNGTTTDEISKWFADSLNFKKTLSDQLAALKKDSDRASEAYQYLYKKNKNDVFYNVSGEISGGINGYVGALAIGVVAFLGSSLILTAVALAKSHDEEKPAKEEAKN